MKKLEARIRPDRLDALKNALTQVGYPGKDSKEGDANTVSWVWQGLVYKLEFWPYVKLEIVGPDIIIDRFRGSLSTFAS